MALSDSVANTLFTSYGNDLSIQTDGIVLATRNIGASQSWVVRQNVNYGGTYAYTNFANDNSKRYLGLWISATSPYYNSDEIERVLYAHILKITDEIRANSPVEDFTTEENVEAFLAVYENQFEQVNLCGYPFSDRFEFSETYGVTNGNVTISGTSTYGYYYYVQFTPAKVTSDNTDSFIVYFTNEDIQKTFHLYRTSSSDTFTVAQTLTNCTSDFSDTTIEANTEFSINITANDGYELTTVTSNIGTVTKTDTGYNISGTATENITISATASAVDTGKIITQNLTNCTSDFVGDKISAETVITIKPDENYTFVNASVPHVSYQDSMGNQLVVNGIYNSIDDFYTITVPYSTSYIGNYVLTAVATVKTDVTSKYGFISIYVPTSDEITTALAERYQSITDSYGYFAYLIDCGEYITSLMKLYVDVPKTTNKQTIMLGSYQTKASAYLATNDKFTVSCGSVSIVGLRENAIDYNNTQIEIYLPFVGMQSIEPFKIMDKTITLEYEINVITGDCLANIIIDGEIVDCFNGNCGFNVPYIVGESDKVTGSLTSNASYLYGFTPFIRVYTPNVSNDNYVFGNNSSKTDLIGNFEGYTEFESVILENINATTNELENIESILKDGVIL